MLEVTSPSFMEGGWIPIDNTGRGKDLSPQLCLRGLEERAVTLAVTLDDASHPLFPNYNHWVIWNIPAREDIPAAIAPGKTVAALPGAVQGVAYGRHRYRGPKPPLHWVHTYVFTVYALDCQIPLGANCGRKRLLEAMRGHILQKAALSGLFCSHRK